MSSSRQPEDTVEHKHTTNGSTPSATEVEQKTGNLDGAKGPGKAHVDNISVGASDVAKEVTSGVGAAKDGTRLEKSKDSEFLELAQEESPPIVPPVSGDRVKNGTSHERNSVHGAPEGPPERAAALPLAAPTGPLPATEKDTPRSPSPPALPPKDEKFLKTDQDVASHPKAPVNESKGLRVDTHGAGGTEGNDRSEMAWTAPAKNRGLLDDSRSEIQSIMEQFDEGMGGPGEQEIMSPRLEFAGPILGSPASHPPRKSSLEPVKAGALSSSATESASPSGQVVRLPPPRSSSLDDAGSAGSSHDPVDVPQAPSSPRPPSIIFKSTPPEPDPEPDLPFDFHRFLEQLRHKSADPVAKFLRSFLVEFGKKQWMVHEQVKIISDFLEFISKKMAQCEVWRTVSDAEFDNAREGMEKLVMNRLYTQTFSPAIPAPEPMTLGKSRQKGAPSPTRIGRTGQHQEDVERDEVLGQKVRIYSWVKEEHLDIKPAGEKGRKFLTLAQQGRLVCFGLEETRTDEVSRATESQQLSCASGQDHLRAQLLQSHLW